MKLKKRFGRPLDRGGILDYDVEVITARGGGGQLVLFVRDLYGFYDPCDYQPRTIFKCGGSLEDAIRKYRLREIEK